jgi:hypothetical protein
MGVPGGKEEEDIDCSYCHKTVGYIVIDGFVRASKIEMDE